MSQLPNTIISFAPGAQNAPRLIVVTPATSEPVTLDEAKLWLKLDSTDDDDLLTELIKAARSVFEQLTGRTLIETVYRAEWDFLPRVGTFAGAATGREIELPRGPVTEVGDITYLDESGDEQDMDADDFTSQLNDPARYGRLWLNEDAEWPTLGSFPGALRVEFTAGYGTADDVPAEIKACLKLLVTHLYQNRTPVNIGNIVNELSYSMRFLIELHQIRGIA